MAIRIHETPNTIRVFFSTTHRYEDTSTLDDRSDLNEVCERAAKVTKKLLIDFRDVNAMSSKLVSKLILLAREAQKQSVDVRCSNISSSVLEILELIGLNNLFREDDDDQDFLGSGVPNPKPPSTLDGQAWPPLE